MTNQELEKEIRHRLLAVIKALPDSSLTKRRFIAGDSYMQTEVTARAEGNALVAAFTALLTALENADDEEVICEK